MTNEEFDNIAQEEFNAIPKRWRNLIANVAFLVADEPSAEDLREAGVVNGTLLGFYKGIPFTERGIAYGIGLTLPDTITLYRSPILHVAARDNVEVRSVIRETLWHEIAHHFGFDEKEVEQREDQGSNRFTV